MAAKDAVTESLLSRKEGLVRVERNNKIKGLKGIAEQLSSACKTMLDLEDKTDGRNDFEDSVIRMADLILHCSHNQDCLGVNKNNFEDKISKGGLLYQCLEKCAPLLRGDVKHVTLKPRKSIKRPRPYNIEGITKMLMERLDSLGCMCAGMNGEATHWRGTRSGSHTSADREFADRRNESPNGNSWEDPYALEDDQIPWTKSNVSDVNLSSKKTTPFEERGKEEMANFKYHILIFHDDDDEDVAEKIKNDIERETKEVGKPVQVAIIGDYHTAGQKGQQLEKALKECGSIAILVSENTANRGKTCIDDLHSFMITNRQRHPFVIWDGTKDKLDVLLSQMDYLVRTIGCANPRYNTKDKSFYKKMAGFHDVALPETEEAAQEIFERPPPLNPTCPAPEEHGVQESQPRRTDPSTSMHLEPKALVPQQAS